MTIYKLTYDTDENCELRLYSTFASALAALNDPDGGWEEYASEENQVLYRNSDNNVFGFKFRAKIESIEIN